MTAHETPRRCIEVPADLRGPPPRTPNFQLVASAVRAYRPTYLGLVLLVLPLFSSGEGARAAWKFIAPVVVVAFAAYVESSVRAVRRLVRGGEVRYATVTRVSLVDGRLIWLALDADPSVGPISAHVRDCGLAAGDRVPVLVARGTSLVGLIIAEGEIEVARLRRGRVVDRKTTRPCGCSHR